MKKLILLAVLLAACSPKPKPTPSPSPTVEATPVPEPTPLPRCEQVTLVNPRFKEPMYSKAVRVGQEAVGDVCAADPVQSLQLLALALNDRGLCAFQMDDAVFVAAQQESLVWEEHHAVFYGNGCWTSNTYRFSYTKE